VPTTLPSRGVNAEPYSATAAATLGAAATVLDHPRALTQSDRRSPPAFASGAVGGECNLVVLDAGNVLHDAVAVRGPGIDAEGEPSRWSD
jgi:hypothetical protein